VKLDELIGSIRENIKMEVTTREAAKQTVERNWSELALQLQKSISENDSVALDVIEEALSNGGEGAAVTCLKEVQTSLSDFNFDKALEQINQGIADGLFR
jgi:uncharacterized membrane-anchored protein YjiN (DUF445 family)